MYMRGNQTPYTHKEFWIPLCYTARLEILFWKTRQKRAGRHNMERGKSSVLQIIPSQMKKLAVAENRIT